MPASLWLAVAHPAVFLPLLGLAVAAMVALLWTLARFLRPLLRRLLRRREEAGASPVP